MKKLALAIALTALVVLPTTGLKAADSHTLNGEFVWNNEDQKGDLEAVFTPTGKKSWDVAFHFVWEGEPHVWKGTAEGKLDKGTLSGQVETDGEHKSQFVFKGKFDKQGQFEGTHAGVRDGEERPTGTMTLGR